MNDDYIIDDDMKEFCYYLEYYDLHGRFPWEKIRVDISLSSEALEKLKGKNRSKIINELVCNKESN